MRMWLAIFTAFPALSAAAWAGAEPTAFENAIRVRLTAPPAVHLTGLVDAEEGRIDLHAGRILERAHGGIRIQTPDGSTIFVPRPGVRVECWLKGESDDAYLVELDRGEEPVRVPRAAVTRMEASDGRSSRAAHVFYGLTLGAGVGAAVGALTGQSCHPSDWLCFSRGDTAVIFAILGAPLGVIGGAAWPVERWRPVHEPAARVSVVPTRGGARVAVALSF